MLLKLFERCLNAKYVHTAEGGDFAIETDGDTLYLLFEWSDGKEDWLNNFAFPAKPYKRMDAVWFCHGGFLKVWKAMRDEIETRIAKALEVHPITRIVCVGYSHGAALTVLATEDMAYLYGDKYTVEGYGFGAPRVLWGIVPKAVKKRLSCFTTVRNVPDLITHVPPFLFGFRNAGKMFKIGWSGPIKSHFPEAYKKELGSDLCGQHSVCKALAKRSEQK